MAYNLRERYCPYCGRTHFMGYATLGKRRRFICYEYKIIFEEKTLS